MNLRRVLGLSQRHFSVLVRAGLTVLSVRIALAFFKYRTIAQYIQVKEPSGAEPDFAKPYVMAWAVKHTARLVPFASCLTQSLALQHMLASTARSSVVRVGARVDENSKMHAHAWVVLDDVVLLGGTAENLDDYKVLTNLVPKSHV